MKRNIIIVVLAIFSCTLCSFAQHTFSINVVDVRDEQTSACLEIYVSDEYFHFDKDDKPVAKIQAVNNAYHYDLPIEEMRSIKLCSYNKDNQLESAVERFAVADESISLSIGYTDYWGSTNSAGYDAKVDRGIWAARNATNWTSPHVPTIKGKKVWKDVYGNCFENTIQDVFFNTDETIIRLYPTYYPQLFMNKHEFRLKDNYFQHDYKMIRKIFGGEKNVTTEQVVYGEIIAFEPIPSHDKSFHFGVIDEEDGYVLKNVIEEKQLSKERSIRLNVDATDAKAPSGFIVKIEDEGRWDPIQKADITLDDTRKFSLTLYSTIPCEKGQGLQKNADIIHLFPTYPDGSISEKSIRIASMPGETADMKITDDGYTISGSKKYKDWQAAADCVKNGCDYRTYISMHAKDEGFVRYFMVNDVIPRKDLYKFFAYGIAQDYSYGSELNSAILLDEKLAKQEEENAAIKRNGDKTQAGDIFVDFEAEYEGTTTHLSDYVGKGKYVLVDFWASWCGPCCAEIPYLKDVYNKYKGDKFEVLGVPTWDKPEQTLKAIEKYGIAYPQMLNAQKAGSDAYGIEGIPEIILFAPDGKIIARGLRGAEIERIVKENLE